jgi:hypothetical protein
MRRGKRSPHKADRPWKQDGPVKRLTDFLAPWAEIFTAYPLRFYPGAILAFSLLAAFTDVFDFDQGFFTAAAEVFPVLLIAMFAELLIEADSFRRHLIEEKDDPEVVSNLEKARFQRAVAVLSTVVIGEVAALWALAASPSSFLSGATSAALVLATGALLGPFLFRIRPGAKKGIYGW